MLNIAASCIDFARTYFGESHHIRLGPPKSNLLETVEVERDLYTLNDNQPMVKA